MKAVPLAIAALVIALGACKPDHDVNPTQTVSPRDPDRLGMKTDVAIAPSGQDGWMVITPSGDNPGPGANPDHVMGVSGQIDLNGDGRPETVQARAGGATWSEFTVYAGDAAGAPVLFTGDGVDLLVSQDRDVNGWPVLALRNRDAASSDIGARKLEEQVWTGAKYEPAPPKP